MGEAMTAPGTTTQTTSKPPETTAHGATTELTVEPLQFMRRLAAIIPASSLTPSDPGVNRVL